MAVWLWNFWVFSFLGWCLERLFAALTRSPQQRRRCLLLLPLCPVYGLGMAAVLAPARSLSHRLAALCIWRSHRHRRGVPLPLVGRRISGCPVLGLFHCPRQPPGRVCLPFPGLGNFSLSGSGSGSDGSRNGQRNTVPSHLAVPDGLHRRRGVFPPLSGRYP